MHSYHSNATTNIHVRNFLKDNPDSQSCRALAERFGLSCATVHKWRTRRTTRHSLDAGSRPLRVRCAFHAEQQQLILHLRRGSQLSLDALLEAVETVIPHATRSSVYRLLVRHGVQRLAQAQKPSYGSYDDEGRLPGFVHVDSFLLTCLPGQSSRRGNRQHCFVAVDRATRLAFLQVYDNCAGASACHFLERCRAFFPFRIDTLLTDNGAQYTLKACAPAKHKKGAKREFEQLCQKHGIRHKTTRPYTPRTNGLVERMNGLIQQQTTKRYRYDKQAQRDKALTDWLNNYNLERKHSRIPIGRMTPLEATAKWQAKQPQQFTRQAAKHTLLRKSCS